MPYRWCPKQSGFPVACLRCTGNCSRVVRFCPQCGAAAVQHSRRAPGHRRCRIAALRLLSDGVDRHGAAEPEAGSAASRHRRALDAEGEGVAARGPRPTCRPRASFWRGNAIATDRSRPRQPRYAIVEAAAVSPVLSAPRSGEVGRARPVVVAVVGWLLTRSGRTQQPARTLRRKGRGMSQCRTDQRVRRYSCCETTLPVLEHVRPPALADRRNAEGTALEISSQARGATGCRAEGGEGVHADEQRDCAIHAMAALAADRSSDEAREIVEKIGQLVCPGTPALRTGR